MEPKQLVEKFNSGEITEEQFDEAASKMTPEQKEELNTAAETAIPSAVEKLKSVRRGTQKIEKGSTETQDQGMSKLRQENFEVAESELFSEYGIDTEEDRSAFRKEFKLHDTGSVNVANIMKDMRKAYAAKNSDQLLALEKEKRQRESEAEDMTATDANPTGSGGGGDPTKKAISKEVKSLMEASAKAGRPLTVEMAEKRIAILRNKGRIS